MGEEMEWGNQGPNMLCCSKHAQTQEGLSLLFTWAWPMYSDSELTHTCHEVPGHLRHCTSFGGASV